jgi:hypothetical protein
MRRLVCFFGVLMWGGAAMAIEEPKYEVLAQEAGFELRQYAPLIVAETWVEGDMNAAASKGFRTLADYIFGNNTVRQSTPGSKIAMTAPVTLEPQGQASKLAMTAPVTVQPTTDGPDWVGAQRWRVQFVMPSQYSLAALPSPNNAAVTLREVPARTVAVAKYSGLNTDDRIRKETQALVDLLQTRRLVAAGPAQLARYDPPWTLPPWRRNEIQIEVRVPSP